MYFRAIGQRASSPQSKCTRGQADFAVGFSKVGTAWLPHIIAETHSQEYNVYFGVMRQRLAAPDPIGNQGQANFRS